MPVASTTTPAVRSAVRCSVINDAHGPERAPPPASSMWPADGDTIDITWRTRLPVIKDWWWDRSSNRAIHVLPVAAITDRRRAHATWCLGKATRTCFEHAESAAAPAAVSSNGAA